MDKMLRQLVRFSSLGGGLAIALISLSLVAPLGMAQTTTSNPSSTDPEATRNPFAEDAQIGDMLDLIHRANFGNSRSSEEIRDDRRSNIQDAAELFRQQQRERLLQQSQGSGQADVPAIVPAPTEP